MTQFRRDPIRPSSVLRLSPKIPGFLTASLLPIIAALDPLHQLPKPIPVSVVHTRSKRERGHYLPSPCEIGLSVYGPHPVATFLHEFGHYIDNRILHPLSREYASRYDVDCLALLDYCYKTKPLKTIAELRGTRSRKLMASDRIFLDEAFEPQEVFARVYLQWVCTKSHNRLLWDAFTEKHDESFVIAGRSVHFHWDPAEFADIIPYVDDLFVTKGLL